MKYWWCWNLFRTLRTSPCLQTVAKLPTTAVQRFKRWTSPRLPLSTPPILVHLKLVQQLGMVGSVGTQGTLARIVPSKNAPQSTINKRKNSFLVRRSCPEYIYFLTHGGHRGVGCDSKCDRIWKFKMITYVNRSGREAVPRWWQLVFSCWRKSLSGVDWLQVDLVIKMML